MIEQIKPLIGEAERKAVDEYLQSGGWLTEFKKTEELEFALAVFLGVKHCILVPSGTVALTLACMTLFNDHRKKVIVPDMTMIATANAAVLAGMEVEFCDIDPDSLCMSYFELSKLAMRKDALDIGGIIYVDFNGRASDLEEIKKLCEGNGWFMIEDACQAFGSCYCDTLLGRFGDISCFSLSPHKIITTGQGGFVVTDNDFHAARIRELKDFGRRQPGVDDHTALGFNFKFTDLQAVVGLAQLDSIYERIDKKKHLYDRYYENLNGKINGIKILKRHYGHTPWFVDIYCGSENSIYRDNIMLKLKENKIGCRKMYPPLHTQAPYKTWVSCPVSERISKTGLWLPSHLALTDDEIDTVCDCILNK